MFHTLTFLIVKSDRIMGKAGVPPAVVYESPMMQARHLLYPLFRPQMRNMTEFIILKSGKSIMAYIDYFLAISP